MRIGLFFLVALFAAFGCSASAGSTSTGSSTSGEAGAGGIVTMSNGGAGGQSSASSSEVGSGGTGAGTSSASGGSGGVGGCMAAPYVCDPKDCGAVANECGFYTNCDAPVGDPPGPAITCEFPWLEDGPMDCNQATHRCECTKEGNTPESLALCNGPNAKNAVKAFCIEHGGCDTALCGSDNNPKAPGGCRFTGEYLPGTGSKGSIWCCSPFCVDAGDCDDNNECTVNACSVEGQCTFEHVAGQPPCDNGSGVCIDGKCIPK